MYSRRDLGKVALAALPFARALAAIDSTVDGVELGTQTYSFRDRPLDPAIDAMKEIGLGECELFMGHVEPPKKSETELRDWRLTVPMSYFQDIRAKFDKAGIKIFAYTFNFRDAMNDAELDRAFEMTKALGTDLITTSTTLTCCKRLGPLAEKHRVRVALHGHDQTDKPNEFSTPETFAEGIAMSPDWFYINLDIGHFVAANYDPIAFIEEHHGKILVLHIKDRKKNHGPNMPFGEGDTPIKGVLQLLKEKHYPMPANIEYEYGKPGMDTVQEVRKCFEFMKAALA
jgi:sugar phosphate isomerase/epimerase